MKRKVGGIDCQYLSGISQMGYRYCGAIKQGDNIIRDVHLAPVHCPINEQIAAGDKEGLQTDTQQLKAEIAAIATEFDSLGPGSCGGEHLQAFYALVIKLRQLSAD
jgi:hypothetical protein